LKEGTEMLGVVVEKTAKYIIIKDPLQIHYRMVAGQSAPSVSMSRFMPFAADPTFMFDTKDVLEVVRARDSVAQYYEYTMESYIYDLDLRIDQEMKRSSIDDVEEMDPADLNETYAELLKKIEPQGPLQEED
jgi:hypothetical protein